MNGAGSAAKHVDAQNFCKTGLANLSYVYNHSSLVTDHQARINLDLNLVMTLIKTKTPAEIEKQQVIGKKYGQATVVNQTGMFAEGGAGRSKFTPEDDELLVMYDYMFSLNNKKWKGIAM